PAAVCRCRDLEAETGKSGIGAPLPRSRRNPLRCAVQGLGGGMRRRDFLGALGAAATRPLAALGQERVPRIGVLVNAHKGNIESQARHDAFLQGLQQLGLIDGQNVRIDMRWGGPAAEAESHRKYAAELAALAPNVILTTTGPSTAATQ